MALIVDARVVAFELPLRAPLETAHGAIATRPGALLRLRTGDGLEGWGEATPVPGFGGPDADATRAMLEKSALALVGLEPEAVWPRSGTACARAVRPAGSSGSTGASGRETSARPARSGWVAS